MLLQKVIHTHQSLDDTKARFERIGGSADRVSHCEFAIGHGFRARAELVRLAGDAANQILFRSLEGNVELAGLVEFFPIRDHLTEVQITLDCTIKSPLHRVLAALTGSVERFVNAQLHQLETGADVGRASQPARSSGRVSMLPATA